jgi:iron complex outermembrane receptor protein
VCTAALFQDISMTDSARIVLRALAAAVVLCGGRAAAQDVFRQTVVVTATATPVELGSITRTLTVITRDEIAALPVHSIADLLRVAASVDVRARGVRGVQSDFAVRGAGFGQMLVLVDGVRLNDAQSGHHNGDIPVPLDAIERIEILHGPGSSLFGADAFGGTVNVVTRRVVDAPREVVEGGSFGLASGRGQAGFERGGVQQTFSAAIERSSGFMYDRDFMTAMARARTTFGSGSGVSISYLRKEFGANNFYGGNAPSREWTNQTLASADHRFGSLGGWTLRGTASYRTHGDRFLFDQERPLRSDNRHRTHAAIATVNGSRRILTDGSVAVGAEAGGEWIRSSNLGDHSGARVSGFGEWRQSLGRATHVDATLRVDRYDEFGASWSPSAGVGWWPSSVVRLRASGGRAFRVPTFTERYYSDPANLARAEVGPEHAWAGEGGADLFLPSGWLLQATVFGRWERDVIDWLRPTPADLWRTYNIRSVETRGVELSARRTFAGGAFAQAHYTHVALDAAAVDQLSKYVLDYAPHSITAAASLPLPSRFRLAPRIEYRRRSRTGGTSDDLLVDARVGRRFGDAVELFVEGTNLLDANYQEIAGVAMPGAAMSVSLAIGR